MHHICFFILYWDNCLIDFYINQDLSWLKIMPNLESNPPATQMSYKYREKIIYQRIKNKNIGTNRNGINCFV
jgi:hypothetical protein